MKNEGPTHLDLFSGIGGFALAAQWTGFRTIGFCEIDKYCQKVLAKNFLSNSASVEGRSGSWVRENGCYSDIFDLDGREFYGVSLITGGFPCQPFSVAGKRRGAADDRHLWPEMLRVIKEARPAWVLGENVPGIITMELDNVLSDLESIGYATRPFVIPACAVDARHRRDRLWIVARDISNASRGRREQCHAEPESENGTVCPGLPNTEYAETARQRQHGRNGLSQSEPIRFSEGSRSKHATWSVEPNVGRVVDGLSVELDFARQIATYEKSHRSKKKPESRFLIGKLLQAMWQYRELAETSPSIYVERLRCCVPEVPLQDSQSRWLLGARIQKEPNLLDLWSIVSTEGFAPAQNVQQLRLLERAWSEKRSETVGNRINRLKALGNAIVPQVAYEILREIRKLC